MNKNQRMEDFFDFWRTIIKQNPNFDLDSPNNSDSIYSTLVFFDTKPEDNDTTLVQDGIFDHWLKHYGKSNKVNVIFDQDDPCYCYFNSTNKKIYHANDCLMIYIPLDHDHIENGVQLVIDYLTQNNITYIAKINKKIRSDDFVLNINNPNEIEGLCNFIEETSFLQEGLIKPNPFIFQYKNLAISSANTLSYNSVLAQYIKVYIQARKNEDKTDNISNQDFIQFVTEFYNLKLSNNSKDEEIIKLFQLSGDDITTKIICIKSITELITNSSKDDFNLDNLIEHYNKYKTPNTINQELTKVKRNTLTDDDITKTNDILNQALKIMTTKFDRENAIKRLNEYIYNNCEQLITRDNGLRSTLINSQFRSNMLCILELQKTTLLDYLNNLEKTNIDIDEINIILNKALDIMIDMYGYDNATKTLNKYIQTNNINLITRKEHLREFFNNSNFRNQIIEYLEVNNLSFYDYIKTIRPEKTKEDYLQEAMIATYEKYEQAYQDGLSENSGTLYIESALKQLLCNNSYKGFTRDNDIRNTLNKNVSLEDTIEIIKNALDITESIDKNAISLEVADYLTKQYIELVLTNYQKKTVHK